MAEKKILGKTVEMRFAGFMVLACEDRKGNHAKRTWTESVCAKQTKRTGIAAMGSGGSRLAAADKRKRRRLKIEEIKILSVEYEAHQRDLRGNV